MISRFYIGLSRFILISFTHYFHGLDHLYKKSSRTRPLEADEMPVQFSGKNLVGVNKY